MANREPSSGSPARFRAELSLFGAAAGAVAALLKLLVHHAFVWARLARPFYLTLNIFLVHGHYQAKGLADAVFAELGDMSLGAAFGVAVSFLLLHSRPKFHWWIGLFSGIGIWYFSLAFGNLTRLIKAEETTGWSLFAHFLSMVAFGLLIVLASRIWRPLGERVGLDRRRIYRAVPKG